MAHFHPEPIWVQYQYQLGGIYWRNRISGEVRWDNPMLVGQGFCIGSPPCGVVVHQNPRCTEHPLGLAVGMHANIIQPIYFFPSVKAIEDAWEKHFDKKQKNYWHNTITKETTWKDPKEEAKKPPPPPPPPPPSPPKIQKREQDLWFKVDDGKGGKKWVNEKTGESQYGVPDCRRRYR